MNKGHDPYNHNPRTAALRTAQRSSDVLAWPGSSKDVLRASAADEQREQRAAWWRTTRPRGK